MDKIKILAAVLALAGCMENGMGMERQNSNEIFKDHIDNRGYLVVTPENIDYVAEHKNEYNWKMLKLKDIDFCNYTYKLGIICGMMNYANVLEFEKCIFNQDVLIDFPRCHGAQRISFSSCIGINVEDKIYVSSATEFFDANFIWFADCHK